MWIATHGCPSIDSPNIQDQFGDTPIRQPFTCSDLQGRIISMQRPTASFKDKKGAAQMLACFALLCFALLCFALLCFAVLA